MAQFEVDNITGDDAGKRLEEPDDEFGLLQSGPEDSTNKEEEVASDDNIQLNDNFESKAGTQTR